jgi:hypothetical protein
MSGAGHVARMVEMRNAYKVFIGNIEGRDRIADRGLDGRIILERILE